MRLRTLGRSRVLATSVHAGDPIHKGQVPITYEDFSVIDLRTRQSSTRAALVQATAAASVARDAYARGHVLSGETVSVGEVQRRRAAAAQAVAEVATQHALLQNLQQQIGQFGASTPDGRGTTIVAPFDCFVTAANVAPGEMLDAGQVVMEVAELSNVWLLVNVYQDDVQQVR